MDSIRWHYEPPGWATYVYSQTAPQTGFRGRMAAAFYLAVIWAFGWLLWRAYSVIQTPNDVLVDKLGLDIPPAPEITLEEIFATEVRIAWNQVEFSSSIHKHIVEVNGTKVGETKRTETTVSILNLTPGTFYDIRVFTVSAPGFQTPSTVLHLRTAQCAKSNPQADNSDGYPTIRAYPAKSNTTINPPTAPAMAREHSGGHPIGRRGTTGRKQSPANLVLESQPVAQYDDSQRSSDEEVAGTLAQLSERFQKVQQDIESTDNEVVKEEEEFETALRDLEYQRDELKQKVRERDEQSSELRKQVHKLESESRAKQNERAKKERQLQQKENQHKRRRDEISTWDEQISTMKEEMSFVEKQQAAIEERTASEIRNLRKKIEDEQREVRLLDEENKEKALQIKALEEERIRLNEDEETEESREADRLDRERDLFWQERQQSLVNTYSNVCHAHSQALKQFEIARDRLTLCENIRRANANSAYAPPPPLDLEAIRKGMRPRRTRQRGSLTSSVSSPMSTHPVVDSYSSNPSFHQQTTSASPTFSGPALFNLKNGMTLIAPSEEPVTTPEETDVLTGGAPMSPRADALLPANLLGDESADDEADNEISIQSAVAESKQVPFPSIGPSGLIGDVQGSPSPASSSSRSFSSPRESLNNVLEPDRRSLQSRRISIDQPDVAENAQSASRKLTTLFSFSRQRGKTLADGPPMLGSLKQGESQSFPRDFGDSADVLAAQRRRRGYSGNWPFPMTNLLPRASTGAAGGKSSDPARLVTTRARFPNPFSGLGKSSASMPAYDPFATRSDSFDASISAAGLRGDALPSRPSSIYSFDNLPRPSTESQFHAWGSHERSNLRGSPLAPDWGASQTWSRSQSRRPSVQYGSTSNLSLGPHIDEDFLEPSRETQRPLQAPIGTRPTSSQRPLTPKLNPAAPSFTTQFFARRADKNKEKAKLKAGEKATPELAPEDTSPPDSRKSRDTQSLAATVSTMESGESLEQTASGQSGSIPAETTPAKETFIHKLKITRKSSSSKFNSWKEKSLFPSRKGEPSTPGELDEDGTTSDQQLGKSMESTSTTPIAEKEERPKGNKSTLSWGFMSRRRKGPKEDLAASEVSESSERTSEVGDDDIAEEVESSRGQDQGSWSRHKVVRLAALNFFHKDRICSFLQTIARAEHLPPPWLLLLLRPQTDHLPPANLSISLYGSLVQSCSAAGRLPPPRESQTWLIMLHNHVPSTFRQPPSLQTGQSSISDGSGITSHQYGPSPAERLATRPPLPPSSHTFHARDASVSRGRTLEAAAAAYGNNPTTHRAQSAQPHLPDSGISRVVPGLETKLERRTSNNYGHHRQTSVIHGVQHSRNTSFTSPATSSPMSPESLASAGPGVNGINGFSPIGRLDAMSPSSLGGSLSAGGMHSQNVSINSALGGPDSASGESPNGGGPGRRQATQPRQRRGNGHNPSHSRGRSEARTPGEYALHHLLNSFVTQADHKINQCISHVGEMVTPVEQLCGPGVDQTFDQLISALGHIARQKPKPLIDSLMFWRKAKGEAATAAKQQLGQQRSANPTSNALSVAPRRNTEPSQNDTGSSSLHVETDIPAASLAGPPTEEAVLAERRATVSVYLVCRVLIEIFEQSSLSAITTELAGRLEEIVFGQLKSVDPAQISNSSLRLANWRIYGQLLGHMSGVNFVSVTAKFVLELDACQKEIAKNPASMAARDAEGRAELLILAMRHLQIKTASGSWPNSCNFVRAVANLFSIAHGQRIKQAYCQVLQSMLLSVAAEADVDLGAVKWKEALEIISTRLGQMLTKVRHWSNAFPLSMSLLCVSAPDSFSSQWLTIISGMATKLKDRSTRGLALQAICRLTWTYMNRIPDAPPARIRKIEDVIKIALPQGKKTNLTTDAAVAEPLIQLIRIIGFRHQELCFRTIIFPLINSDLFASGRDLRVEQMEPEKMVIGIRAFLAIMLDLEKGEQGCPPFPQSFPNSSVIEPLPASPLPTRVQLVAEAKFPTAAQNDNASRLVNTSNLSEVAKQYYLRFCEILGKITILCDNTFGGQATLNEKFGGPTPKTPLSEAFSFTRKEDGSIGDQKQAYYDLLHVAIQALPRCLSDHIPFTSLINLLCTGSAHIQSSIASSSAQSLRSIARQGHAQAVAIAFPRFIFNYDSKYSTMSDEGMLGSGHIETTLTLYIELLQIWVDELRQKTIGTADEQRDGAGAAITRAMPLEMTNVYPHVDEIEAYGLFFLCSQSRKVRAFAVKVLRMVTEFDKAMGKDEHTRIIRILEDQSDKVLDLNDDSLSVAERSRLQMGKRKNATQNTLIEICSSEVSYDSTLWYKVFPNLIRITFDTCPNAIALSRGIVCDRLLQMHNAIEYLAHDSRPPQYVAQDFRVAGRSASTSPDVLIDQWKLYLVMACVTLSSAGAQSQSQLANAAHTRKQSKSDVGSREKLSSARALFSAIIPLLSAGPDSIRNAIVLALGSIKHKLYRTLLESLQYAVTKCNDEAKARIGTHQRTPSNPQRYRSTERLRTEVTHVYKLTSSFLRDIDVCNDDWILNNLVTYAKDLRIFLSDAEIQNDWEFQRLRFHYCGLMEEVFEGINRSRNPSRWLPFESRKSAFTLMEDWCGYSSNQGQIAQREDVMKQSAFAQQQETGERQNLNSAMEIEKKNLRIAALSAMAALCAGPISIKTESNAILQFHLPRMLSWIESIFATISDKMHAIGRRALKELIVNNIEHPVIMEHSVERCYRAERPKALESYFEVVSQVLIEHKDYPLAFWRILGAVLFTLGNENRDIRMKSAHLLRTLEERQQKSSKLQDFDISISDKTTAVYKLAQFEYSKRLSKAHSELAFVIFSEFSLHFKNVSTDHQRNMVAAILPWIQTIELQVDPNGGPIAVSYMLLSNLFEITIRSSNVLHNEVQALWQALATGPHGGNVQLILDFIITLSLERREQNFVHYAKQIVVYLSATPAGARVIEFFLLQLIPKNMVNEKKPVEQVPPDMKGLPYVADLAAILPTGTKQAGLSLGQIALIFLVDLMVTPVTLPTDNAIKLIHATLILWDHYAPTVQEQAREMLVHLIHELVTSKIGDEVLYPKRKQIEKLVESIRENESKVVWGYEDSNGKDDSDGASRVPQAMSYLTKEVVDLFSLVYEGMNDLWAKEALQWASTCPVRHLACRSFQVFRCISVTLDSRMLADMLARLSNTIADEETDYQTFSMEILTTLKVIIGALSPSDLLRYPQLFWTTCACLNTIHEKEFSETLGMLEKLLDRMDMADPAVIKTMMDSQPPKWEGGFEGLQPLVYKGLNSADSLDRTLLVLHRLAELPNSSLVGDASRLLYGVLANLPRFLHQYDLESQTPSARACAMRLAEVASQQGCAPVARSLADFADSHYSLGRDFLVSIITAIRTSFFPESEAKSLIFMMGLLTNKSSWFRLKTMEVLCVLIPEVDMSKPDISCHGPDLISPLLRLLQTDLCPQALDVMDHIMEVSGNPMERHHMRMSLASGSARAIRKEYERTQSLYGIPLSSGWSIPVPAVYSSRTRNNVHAVFYTCGDAEVMHHQATDTPEVEFHTDESYSDSYFPATRTATMKSVDTVTDTNMGDLVHKLDSLDDFFDEPDSANDLIDDSAEMRDLGTNIYDQQTAPLLRKSLGRTASSASFHNGLADSRPPTSHHHQQPSLAVMNPMAFTTAVLPGSTSIAPSSAATVTGLPPTQELVAGASSRPPLHARSITSPANAYQASQPSSVPLVPILTNGSSFLHDDNDDNDGYDDVVFVDSESSPFPEFSVTSTTSSITQLSGPGPGILTGLSNHTTPTSATESNGPFNLESMRRNMRRLTGGKSESQKEKDRIREMARMRALSGGHSNATGSGVSPRVPKVPLEYLNGNVGGGGASPATSPGT